MRIQFNDIAFEAQLLPLQSKGNEEYVIVDTGCILGALRHFDSVLHRIQEDTLRLAILENTINEVVEHLLRSQDELNRKGFSTSGIRSAIENFRKFLQYDAVNKIANPKVSEKAFSPYEHFREDRLVAYVLFEGNFKAVATQDRSFAERLGEGRYIPCELLWTEKNREFQRV
jgi:predicted nucleic acid-binding protein